MKWAVILTCLSITGCCNCPKVETPIVKPSRPQTDPMPVVLDAINHNALQVPSLWTQLEYSASIVDRDKKQTTNLSGDGAMMFRRPGSLVMTGDKDIAGRVFEMGVNDQQFWVKLRSDANAWNYWWGNNANVGKPCCRPVPVDPSMLVQVLGVSAYGTDFLQQPVPVMRYDPDADAYVFDFNVRQPDRWVTLKEVWYDAEFKRPIKVLLYDANGRPVLIAHLANHQPVEVEGSPQPQWPVVAWHYDLAFPDSGSRMTIDFTNPAVTHPGRHGTTLPGPRTFDRPDPDDNNSVIQVDRACAGETP